MIKHLITGCLLIFAGQIAFVATITAGENTPSPKKAALISIIIDDLGWRKKDGFAAIQLPGSLTYAILPQTPNSKALAIEASRLGKEIMLHIPMEAVENNHLLGPGALTRKMTRAEFNTTLEANLLSVPGVVGINNHMGSLLTKHELSMHRLMYQLQKKPLFFIDSVTSKDSLAMKTAMFYRVPHSRRNIFLDNDQEPAQIRSQFFKLVELAEKNGSALGIAHPHPETISTLKNLLPQLDELNVNLVSVSEFIKYQNRTGS